MKWCPINVPVFNNALRGVSLPQKTLVSEKGFVQGGVTGLEAMKSTPVSRQYLLGESGS